MSEVISCFTFGLSWNLAFSRDLHDWEVLWVSEIMFTLNEVFLFPSFEDQRAWALDSSGRFLLN